MGRTFIPCLACCISVGLATAPAQANDRNAASAAHGREALSGSSAGHEAHAILGSRDSAAGSAARSIEATYSSRPNDATVQQTGPAPSREHNGLTLFQFNSKLGHVAVQPVVGTVKGAQFSMNF